MLTHNDWEAMYKAQEDDLRKFRADAERDALARQNLALREALEKAIDAIEKVKHWHNTGKEDEGTIISTKSFFRLHEVGEDLAAALSLPLPDAAREVEEWREKAGMLDKWAEAWEAYSAAPCGEDDEEQRVFVDADIALRRWARESAALRAAKAGK